MQVSEEHRAIVEAVDSLERLERVLARRDLAAESALARARRFGTARQLKARIAGLRESYRAARAAGTLTYARGG